MFLPNLEIQLCVAGSLMVGMRQKYLPWLPEELERHLTWNYFIRTWKCWSGHSGGILYRKWAPRKSVWFWSNVNNESWSPHSDLTKLWGFKDVVGHCCTTWKMDTWSLSRAAGSGTATALPDPGGGCDGAESGRKMRWKQRVNYIAGTYMHHGCVPHSMQGQPRTLWTVLPAQWVFTDDFRKP